MSPSHAAALSQSRPVHAAVPVFGVASAADGPTPGTWSVRFTLLADAEPALLSRVLAPFARRDLVPDHLAARRLGAALRVEVGMDSMPAEAVSLVEGNLRQIVGLRSLVRDDVHPAAVAA